MKHIQILSVILLLSSCREIEILTDDVPQPVITNFHSKYPYASDVEWEVAKRNGRLAYEAEFKLEKKKKETWYKPDGTILKEK